MYLASSRGDFGACSPMVVRPAATARSGQSASVRSSSVITTPRVRKKGSSALLVAVAASAILPTASPPVTDARNRRRVKSV